MASDPDGDLTEKPSDRGLGGLGCFAEAGSIEPGVGDNADKPIREKHDDLPNAPSSPTDQPAA